MYKAILKTCLIGSLAFGLSACTVVVKPNVGLAASTSNLITRLVPERGQGSTYRVGEKVRFKVTVRDAGYVTLVALQPNGYANVLVRDAYVKSGTTYFPRRSDAVTYDIAAPRGLQRVRAIFTRVRPTTRLVLRGVYNGNRWNTVTTQYLTPYAAEDRDVQETYLYIR